jgi:hypothetical protein
MVSMATLEGLQDGELKQVIEQSNEILKRRDEERKAKAMLDARAILAAAGLTLKDIQHNGNKKAGRGPFYIGGHTYQHPSNKALAWNAKGQKPNWLRELEAEGGKAIDIAAVSANDNQMLPTKRIG